MKSPPKKTDLEISRHRAKQEMKMLTLAIKALEANINAMSAVEVRNAQRMANEAIFAMRERIREIEWANYS